MEPTLRLLQALDIEFKGMQLDDISIVTWGDSKRVHNCVQRLERGDTSGWEEFLQHLTNDREISLGFSRLFEQLHWAVYSDESDRVSLTLPDHLRALDDDSKARLESALNTWYVPVDDKRPRRKPKSTEVVFIEEKSSLHGHARIGRVSYSSSRKTIYYSGRRFQSLKGERYKANYFDVESGLNYWISKCKKNGNDTLYPGIIEIDEDAREEYWLKIRRLPDNIQLTRFRSAGKYSKRRPT